MTPGTDSRTSPDRSIELPAGHCAFAGACRNANEVLPGILELRKVSKRAPAAYDHVGAERQIENDGERDPPAVGDRDRLSPRREVEPSDDDLIASAGDALEGEFSPGVADDGHGRSARREEINSGAGQDSASHVEHAPRHDGRWSRHVGGANRAASDADEQQQKKSRRTAAEEEMSSVPRGRASATSSRARQSLREGERIGLAIPLSSNLVSQSIATSRNRVDFPRSAGLVRPVRR